MKLWSPLFVDEMHIRMWDDDSFGIVYNTVNGDTHLIEPLEMELLHLLADSPSSVNELADELADVFTDNQENTVLAVIEGSLMRLQNIGLVACCLN